MNPVVLFVRDGWGINPKKDGNAIRAAKTPNVDRLLAEYPSTALDASGPPVGLPEGYQGSSEVGHLNMGAGRIVEQELKRINDALENGSFFSRPAFREIIDYALKHNSRLHLLCLIQDEGVHAHQEHLFKIMARARAEGVRKLVIHFFADGRDTPPRSALGFLDTLEKEMARVGGCCIGTLMGRYYAMDRSRNWDLTDRAFEAIIAAKGRKASSAREAIETAYANDRTPDDVEMFDEYIPPSIIGNYAGVADEDAILHVNYRQDRAIQLSMAFAANDYPGKRSRRPKIAYAGLTRYYDEFDNYVIESIDTGAGMTNLLGEVISRAGIRQLRISETQKFRHVTSFFNGKMTKPFPLEDQVEIPSQYDPATFASHPEMNAYDVTDELLRRLKDCPYGFIAVNLANCDMVGHTGDFTAAVRAVEVVDECVGKIIARLMQIDAHVLLTADHGNAEQMIDPASDLPQTAHTTNPVECIYIAADAANRKMVKRGKLADIAPTILELMHLPIPKEMTAQSLFKN